MESQITLFVVYERYHQLPYKNTLKTKDEFKEKDSITVTGQTVVIFFLEQKKTWGCRTNHLVQQPLFPEILEESIIHGKKTKIFLTYDHTNHHHINYHYDNVYYYHQ